MSRQEDATALKAAPRRPDWTLSVIGRSPEPARNRADVTAVPLRPCRPEGRLYE